MVDTVILNNLELPVKNAMSDRNNNMKFMREIKKYIDKNSEVLYANAPLYRLYFQENERNIVYDITGIKKKYVEDLLKKVDTIKSAWEIANSPFNILMTIIIREYAKNKEKKLLENAILYLSLSFYSTLHVKYYRHFLPNENAMTYTVNNLSNKFLFKKYGIIMKAIFHTAIKSHEKYEKELIGGKDADIVNYLMFLKTRLNNLMKNFTREYMKNLENKKYLNTEKDSNDEENYFETDNISLSIARLSSQTTQKFYSSELNDKLIRVSCRFSNTSPITLKKALQSMKQTERDKVSELIQSILQVYLVDGKNSFDSISSQRFIAYSISTYSKSNTKDKNILKIKKLLDYFLKNNSDKYSDTEREATRVGYRKGLYMYFVLFIQSIQVRQ